VYPTLVCLTYSWQLFPLLIRLLSHQNEPNISSWGL